jgi:hypothetical protein
MRIGALTLQNHRLRLSRLVYGDHPMGALARDHPDWGICVHLIETEIDIAATPERVWSTLTDFAAYPSWNPFIRSIEGNIQQGERLQVSIQPVGGRAMTFRPTVLVVIPNFELRWLGHFLIRGIFDGEHYFQLRSTGLDRVRFVQAEKFSGLLVGVAKSDLDAKTRAGFVAMNQALKARAENVARA